MKKICSVRELDGFRRQAISYLDEGRRSLTIGLEDRLDPEEWEHSVSPIRHAIRSNMAVRSLIDYLLADRTDQLTEYSKAIQGYVRVGWGVIVDLDFDHLSEHDLWNLSNYGDSTAAIDILAAGELKDSASVQFASHAYCRRQEMVPDFECGDDFEEQRAYEYMRKLLLKKLDQIPVGDFEANRPDLDPEQSIFSAVLQLMSLCARIMAGCEESDVIVGADALYSLVRMKWYDSRIEGSFDMTSDHLLLVAYAQELAFGTRKIDPAVLISRLRPEQIHDDVNRLLDLLPE